MTDANQEPLSIVVIGASGDLARRKIFPALFSLYCQKALPPDVRMFGFARTRLDDAAFRRRITEHLTCRYAAGASCAEQMETFLQRCHYVTGQYGSTDSILDLYQRMRELEVRGVVNRMYYLAIPPSIFVSTAESLGNTGLVSCGEAGHGWARVVVEKPFGRDRPSSDELARALGEVFQEPDIFRIDHYLGKEVIQNLLVLRFANSVFEPQWNCRHLASVHVTWSENLALEGRAGYFDRFGIIRDVMQNHLLQMLALLAMEPPDELEASAIRRRKVQLLQSITPVTRERLVTGQFVAGELDGRKVRGYTEDPDVPDDSRTETYAAALLTIDNARWQGVPFFLSAGKGLESRCTTLRLRFHPLGHRLFAQSGHTPAPNELVIRVQPDEGMHLSLTTKRPGLEMKLTERKLDLSYGQAFHDHIIPDAYEGLLLEVMRGDRSLFLSSEELAAAWDVFTPVLHALESRAVCPEHYRFGGPPPAAARRLLQRAEQARGLE